jgi:ABC-2 type transport system ATP-binding protein
MSLDIELRDLTVRFGDVAAVDSLSLRLEGGKIHGLLGRNGAGKSTLLSVLAAYRKPSSGAALVGGSRAVRECGDHASDLPHAGEPGRLRRRQWLRPC